MRRSAALFLLPLVVLAGTQALADPGQPGFRPGAPIAAPDGRWDYASWDAAHHRLLVAHGSDVLVVDPDHPEAPRTIGQLQHAHGVLAIPGGDRILADSGQDNSVRILDGASGLQLASIAVGGDPDAAILSADGTTAYVMNARSGEVSVIDLGRMAETARIAVKPALEAAVLAGPGLIAVNNEDAGEIDLVDLAAGKAAGVIALPGCEGPTGMAYDPEAKLSLSSCANGVAALVDPARRRLVALLPIGSGPDTVIWQAAYHRFLVPCGKSGEVSIISLVGAKPHVLPAVATEASARTAALDPASGRLYLPAARFAPAEAGKRPAMIPGSFHIFVLDPAR